MGDASCGIGLRLWSWFGRKGRPIQLRLQLGDEIVTTGKPGLSSSLFLRKGRSTPTYSRPSALLPASEGLDITNSCCAGRFLCMLSPLSTGPAPGSAFSTDRPSLMSGPIPRLRPIAHKLQPAMPIVRRQASCHGPSSGYLIHFFALESPSPPSPPKLLLHLGKELLLAKRPPGVGASPQ